MTPAEIFVVRAELPAVHLVVVREQIIDTIRLQLLAAATSDTRHAAWSALRDETTTRPLAQIRRMEVARGLRE